MKSRLLAVASVLTVLSGPVAAGTYTWSGGSGDFTDWDATTVTEADDIRFWSTGVNTPWFDGREGVDAAVPNFENCTFTDTTRVTFGGEAAVEINECGLAILVK